MLRRLCLGCLEDWTHADDLRVDLCPMCRMEREFARQAAGSWSGDVEPAEWWGWTLKDVQADEDFVEGYYLATPAGDFPLHEAQHPSEYH